MGPQSIKNLRVSPITVLALSAYLIFSCKKGTVTTKAIISNAIVLYSGNPAADGCGWLLKINGTDSLYSPLNLTDNFKIDSLKVNLSYTILDSKFGCGQLLGSGITQIKLGTIIKL